MQNRGLKHQSFHGPASIHTDQLVLAKYSRDNTWYRARVLGTDVTEYPATFSVYYVDYGNTETVTLDR